MRKVTAVYMLVIAAAVVCALVFGEVGGFLGSSLYSVVFYALCFLIFICTVRTEGLRGREVLRKYAVSKNVLINEIITVILLGGVMITSYLLVQMASVDFFGLFDYTEIPGEPIDSITKYLVSIVTVALLPAVCEELIFRGILLRNMMQFGRVKAVIASSVLFSLFHMNPSQTVYQFALGAACAVLVIVSGKLVLGMLLHFVNNFVIITYTFIAGSDELAVVWNVSSVVTCLILFILGSLIAWRLIMSLSAVQKQDEERKRFVTFENIGYFVCIVVAGAVWITNFLV